jgi:hypothetical protein
MNSVLNLFDVVYVGQRRVLFCSCLFWLAFLDVLVYFMSFDEQRHLVRHFRFTICPFCWIFKAVCILSYLLVSRFSLAYCRAVCFFALVKILAENIPG